jgi:hypothetical protein
MNELEPYHISKTIKSILIRVNKSDSSFVYFTFESNENLAFYSTTKESLDKNYRDVQLNTTPEFYSDVLAIINKLKERFPIEVLNETKSVDL